MRSFVAVPIDDKIKDAILQAAAPLRELGVAAKWVERENLHLTLKFLGEIDQAQVDKLCGLLRAVRHGPIDLAFQGMRHFGRRVVWVGCNGELRQLAQSVETAAVAVGVPPEERGFSAHVSIARLKNGKNVKALTERLAPDTPFGKQTCRAFVMYKSTLTPTGPEYSLIESFPLHA
jgi:2'-5' RNA ligase